MVFIATEEAQDLSHVSVGRGKADIDGNTHLLDAAGTLYIYYFYCYYYFLNIFYLIPTRECKALSMTTKKKKSVPVPLHMQMRTLLSLARSVNPVQF